MLVDELMTKTYHAIVDARTRSNTEDASTLRDAHRTSNARQPPMLARLAASDWGSGVLGATVGVAERDVDQRCERSEAEATHRARRTDIRPAFFWGGTCGCR
jgi:hypothetical protein